MVSQKMVKYGKRKCKAKVDAHPGTPIDLASQMGLSVST
jgi:hypothetical protein